VRVPTTVAAMVDAAFAEKASLDGFAIKDALSVPSRAAGVVVDPRFADTVLDGVWRGGFGEIMRLALVSGAALTKKLAANVDAIRARDTETTDALIAAAVELRLKKGGTPFALWSALRFQTLSGFKLPHGYAVPMGICLDCAYAAEKGYLPRETCSWVRGTLEACGALDGLAHSQHLLAQPERLLAGLDAWRLATGSTALVLPSGIGSSCEEAVPDRDVYQTAIASQLAIPKGT
jgi:3-dehydroquinate synthase